MAGGRNEDGRWIRINLTRVFLSKWVMHEPMVFGISIRSLDLHIFRVASEFFAPCCCSTRFSEARWKSRDILKCLIRLVTRNRGINSWLMMADFANLFFINFLSIRRIKRQRGILLLFKTFQQQIQLSILELVMNSVIHLKYYLSLNVISLSTSLPFNRERILIINYSWNKHEIERNILIIRSKSTTSQNERDNKISWKSLSIHLSRRIPTKLLLTIPQSLGWGLDLKWNRANLSHHVRLVFIGHEERMNAFRELSTYEEGFMEAEARLWYSASEIYERNNSVTIR